MPNTPLGESCRVDADCAEGVCRDLGSGMLCSATCIPDVSNCRTGQVCADDFEGSFVCQEDPKTGGCCSVAGTKRGPLPWLGGVLFLLGLLILRRKRVL